MFADHFVGVAETRSALLSLIDVHVYNCRECWCFDNYLKKYAVVTFSKLEMYWVSGFEIMKPFLHVFWLSTRK